MFLFGFLQRFNRSLFDFGDFLNWSALPLCTTSTSLALKPMCSQPRLLVMFHAILSASLSLLEQWLQAFGGTRLLISHTLFWTNCFHPLSSPWIHVTWEIGINSSKRDPIWEISQAEINAESSSRRGIVCSTSGATLVFEVTNLNFAVSIFKYTTAAYALADASQKLCKFVDCTLLATPKK